MGWNLTPGESGRASISPNALYMFHQADWEAFQPPKDEETFGFTFWQETLAPLETAGVIDPLEGKRALTTEVAAIPTPRP